MEIFLVVPSLAYIPSPSLSAIIRGSHKRLPRHTEGYSIGDTALALPSPYSGNALKGVSQEEYESWSSSPWLSGNNLKFNGNH